MLCVASVGAYLEHHWVRASAQWLLSCSGWGAGNQAVRPWVSGGRMHAVHISSRQQVEALGPIFHLQLGMAGLSPTGFHVHPVLPQAPRSRTRRALRRRRMGSLISETLDATQAAPHLEGSFLTSRRSCGNAFCWRGHARAWANALAPQGIRQVRRQPNELALSNAHFAHYLWWVSRWLFLGYSPTFHMTRKGACPPLDGGILVAMTWAPIALYRWPSVWAVAIRVATSDPRVKTLQPILVRRRLAHPPSYSSGVDHLS